MGTCYIELCRHGSSNDIYVLSRNIKISEFLSENFQFLVVKFSVYLNRHVYPMVTQL